MKIKEGYVLFSELAGFTFVGTPMYTGNKYVLLLVDYYDEAYGPFRAGELVNFEKVKHFLHHLKLKTGVYKKYPRTIFNAMHDSVGLYLKLKEE
jgi:hypothetical protein